jgi:death-on-curing family protein
VNSIELYRSMNGETQIEVRFEKDTVWLTLSQLSELFGRDKSVISRHLKNIFQDEELDYSSTVAKNATVQKEGKRTVERVIEFYNLDAIISVGYRVNSIKGTQFRIWATKRLKEYLIQGFAINQKRLNELNQLVEIIGKADHNDFGQINESRGLLEILKNYTKSFILLNQYDSHTLELSYLEDNLIYQINYDEAIKAISILKQQLIDKSEASDLFGKQKDQSFTGILKTVTQTFREEYLYPTIEEQAAHLLYFIIKNHPFADGNKRIGSLLFIWFLDKNSHLFKKTGERKINDNALTALTLLVAQSSPDDKELMIKLICNLIN